MSANDRQEGGQHYRNGIQHWDAIKDWMTPEQYIGYLLGSASKYLARYNHKDGRTGVKKSRHYLEKLLEFLDEKDKKETGPIEPEVIGRPGSFQKLPVTKQSLQGRVTTTHLPASDTHYVYEGGTKEYELYTCKLCKAHFQTPLGSPPDEHHSHPEEATKGYVGQ